MNYSNSLYGKPEAYYTIPELIELIRNNPFKARIEHLRTFAKGTNEYNAIKTTQLPVITFNATFKSNFRGSDIVNLSGYIYFDVDYLYSDEEKNEVIEYLKTKDYVYSIWTSSGGCGIGFLVKCCSISINTFKHVWNTIKADLNLPDKYSVDKACCNVNRKTFLSLDADLYLNNEVKEFNNFITLKDLNSDLKTVQLGVIIKKNTYNSLLHPKKKTKETDTPDLAENAKYTKINFRTQDESIIDEDYKVYAEGKDYCSVFIPRDYDGKPIIKVNLRNNIIITIINTLIYNNPTIQERTLYKIVQSINTNFCQIPLDESDIIKKIRWCMQNETTTAKTTKKYVWFNPKKYIPVNEKKSIGAKESAKLRKIRTLNKIKQTILELLEECVKLTNNVIAERSNLSLRTVKTYTKQLGVFNNDFNADYALKLVSGGIMSYIIESATDETLEAPEIIVEDVEASDTDTPSDVIDICQEPKTKSEDIIVPSALQPKIKRERDMYDELFNLPNDEDDDLGTDFDDMYNFNSNNIGCGYTIPIVTKSKDVIEPFGNTSISDDILLKDAQISVHIKENQFKQYFIDKVKSFGATERKLENDYTIYLLPYTFKEKLKKELNSMYVEIELYGYISNRNGKRKFTAYGGQQSIREYYGDLYDELQLDG